jgi:hypothetical protein
LCTSYLAPPLFQATLHAFPAGKIALRAPSFPDLPLRSLQLRAAGEPKDGDIFSEDFASYNNVDDASVFEGAPKFSTPTRTPTQKKDGGFEVGFGSSFPLTEQDMTDELKERVYYVMLDALDNYPPEEVGRMLDLLWEAGTLNYNTTCILFL